MVELGGGILGETQDPIALETSEDNHAAAVDLVRQARRTLVIFTHDLDARVYDTGEFASAVSALARRGRLSRIRILVQDTGPATRSGHRLVDLAQRLSSFVEIRKVSREFEHYNRAFLVVDEIGLLERDSGTEYGGRVWFHNPLSAREYGKLFQNIWDHASPEPSFRRLHL